MLKMVFQTTPSMIIERGASTRLATHVRALGGTSVLVVTDAGVIAARLLDAVLAGFEGTGIAVTVFSQVQADPPESVILAAVEAAKACGADCVLGLGGGSSLDAAKLAALLARSGESLTEIYGINQTKGPRLPLILVPTTAGTGSEVTSVSVVTTGAGEKNVVYSPMLLPDVAVLDAELTLGLPTHVTAATGIDAMVHAIEAYTSRTRKNPISDGLATAALALLGANLPKVLANGQDLPARSAMLQGSLMAGMAFVNASVAAIHALAYPLGARFHIPHGHANALVMAPVIRFNLANAQRQYAELAAYLLPGEHFVDEASAAEAFVQAIEGLVKNSGLEQRLSNLNVDEDSLQVMASEVVVGIRRLIDSNPRDMNEQDVEAIYRSVF